MTRTITGAAVSTGDVVLIDHERSALHLEVAVVHDADNEAPGSTVPGYVRVAVKDRWFIQVPPWRLRVLELDP